MLFPTTYDDLESSEGSTLQPVLSVHKQATQDRKKLLQHSWQIQHPELAKLNALIILSRKKKMDAGLVMGKLFERQRKAVIGVRLSGNVDLTSRYVSWFVAVDFRVLREASAELPFL